MKGVREISILNLTLLNVFHNFTYLMTVSPTKNDAGRQKAGCLNSRFGSSEFQVLSFDRGFWAVGFQGLDGIITAAFGRFRVVIEVTAAAVVISLCINFTTAAELFGRVVNSVATIQEEKIKKSEFITAAAELSVRVVNFVTTIQEDKMIIQSYNGVYF